MTENHERSPLPPTLVKVITEQLRRLRRERGWSARELGERCEAAGLAWDRNIVANVEHGRRSNFTVTELVTLAHVFNVPPLLLLCPQGFSSSIEFLPGHVATPWAIVHWFAGLDQFPRPHDEAWHQKYGRGEYDEGTGLHEWYDHPESGWMTLAEPLALLLRHKEQVRACFGAAHLVRTMTDPPMIAELDDLPDATLEKLRDRLRSAAIRELAQTRREMRGHGLALPPLPQGLKHIDDEAR